MYPIGVKTAVNSKLYSFQVSWKLSCNLCSLQAVHVAYDNQMLTKGPVDER